MDGTRHAPGQQAIDHALPASEDESSNDQDTSLPASEEGENELIGDIPEQPVSHPGIIPPPD